MIVLETAGKNDFPMIKKLYMQAFPPEERPPFFLIRRGLRRGKAEMLAAKEDGVLVGFAYTVPYADLVYLFFLAVDPNRRGGGYGSAILTLLKERYAGKRLFLGRESMDETAENYPERCKRREFYIKNGFHDLPVQIKESGVVYEVMSTSEPTCLHDWRTANFDHDSQNHDMMSTGDRLSAEEYDALITGWCGRLVRKLSDMQVIYKSSL